MLVKKKVRQSNSSNFVNNKTNRELAKNEGYISLTQAANLCSYSQEYLSLLARRGELKCRKFGRNWFTRKEWLEEYVALHPAERKGNVKGKLVKEQEFKKQLELNALVGKNLKSLYSDLIMVVKDYLFLLAKKTWASFVHLVYNVINILVEDLSNVKVESETLGATVVKTGLSGWRKLGRRYTYFKAVAAIVIFLLTATTLGAYLAPVSFVKSKAGLGYIVNKTLIAARNFSSNASYAIYRVAGDEFGIVAGAQFHKFETGLATPFLKGLSNQIGENVALVKNLSQEISGRVCDMLGVDKKLAFYQGGDGWENFVQQYREKVDRAAGSLATLGTSLIGLPKDTDKFVKQSYDKAVILGAQTKKISLSLYNLPHQLSKKITGEKAELAFAQEAKSKLLKNINKFIFEPLIKLGDWTTGNIIKLAKNTGQKIANWLTMWSGYHSTTQDMMMELAKRRGGTALYYEGDYIVQPAPGGQQEVIVLKGEKGDKGEPGERGEKGEIGAVGPAGPVGISGGTSITNVYNVGTPSATAKDGAGSSFAVKYLSGGNLSVSGDSTFGTSDADAFTVHATASFNAPVSIPSISSNVAIAGNLNVTSNATTTGSFHSPEICIGNDCNTAWPSGGTSGDGAWEEIWTNAITPTTTGAGIFVTASSTIDSTLRVNDDLIVGATDLFVDTSTNNIGIGTASPGATLHVSGTYDPLYVSATSGHVAIFNTSFYEATGFSIATSTFITASTTIAANATTTGHFSADDIFYVKDSRVSIGTPTSTELFRVGTSTQGAMLVVNEDSGYVGIGTVSPENLLDIINTAGDVTLKVQSDDQGDSYIKILEGANNEPVNDYGGLLKYVGVSNRFEIGTIDNNLEYPVIYLNRGVNNIGIGTASPGATLHVSGTYDPLYVSATSGKVAIFDTTFQDKYGLTVATTTYFSNDVVINTKATATTALWVGSAGTADSLDLAGGDLYVQDDLEVDGSIILGGTAKSSWPTGGSGAWGEYATNVIAPTNTSAGIFVYASSTIAASATVTDALSIGSATAGASLDFSGGDLYVLDDAEIDGTLTSANIAAFTLTGKLTAGSSEIEGSGFDIDGGDMTGVTISGGLTWSAAQDLNDQALTNVNIDSGDVSAITVSGGLTWSAAQDLNSQNLTNADIDSGTIDGTTIGASSASTAIFSDATVTAELVVGASTWAAPTSSIIVLDGFHLISGTATSSDAAWIGSAGTADSLDLAGGDLYVQDDLEVDGSIILGGTAKSAWPTGGSGAWGEVWSNTLAPTNTSAGIFVYASSTINSTLRVNDTLTVTQASTSNKGLVVQAAGSTGANLLQFQNSSGSFLSGFTVAGGLLMNISSSTALNIQDGSGNAKFQVDSSGSDAGIDITAVAAQNENLFNLYDSSSVYLSGFTVAGGLVMNISSTTAVTIQDGSASTTLVVDTTNTKVGIGTSTPDSVLEVHKNKPSADEVIFRVSTSTGVYYSGTGFSVDEDGDIFYDGSASSPAADYAEYFWTLDSNLTSGEAVCVDVSHDNTVKRCQRERDGNAMGIVSTRPAIIGNVGILSQARPFYDKVIVGMLGQVEAKVSTENGPIRAGDSLTPASQPGYVMRADAGDPTVGVALEAFGLNADSTLLSDGASADLTEEQEEVVDDEEVETEQATSTEDAKIKEDAETEQATSTKDEIEIVESEENSETALTAESNPSASSGSLTGTINVLISRRNKSLTVEQVEEEIMKRIADMEIEDEVDILIAQAMDNLGVEEQIEELALQITESAQGLEELGLTVEDLQLAVDGLQLAIGNDQSLVNSSHLIINSQEVEFAGAVKVAGSLTINDVQIIGQQNSGQLVIGSSSPTSTVEVVIQGALQVAEVKIDNELRVASTLSVGVGSSTSQVAYNRFGTSTPDQAAIATSNDVYIAGDLEVDGDIYLDGETHWQGGDLAENILVRALTLEEITTSTQASLEIGKWTSLPEPGDVLMIDPVGEWSAVKSYQKNSNKILGVVSEEPAATLRSQLELEGENIRPLALIGSVAVKVSLENGPIKKGDLLTTASMPGYTMKATSRNAGILGIALENYGAPSDMNAPNEEELLEGVFEFGTTTKEEVIDKSLDLASSTSTTTTDNKADNTSQLNIVKELLKDKILVLLTINNNLEYAEEVSVAVIDNPDLENGIEVVDYDFQGNVAVKDLVVTGQVVIMGEAEFLAEAKFKNNLNLQGALVREYQEAEEEYLQIGDAVYISGSKKVARAYSDAFEFKPAIGVVVKIVEADINADEYAEENTEAGRTVKVAIGGTVSGFKDLMPGATYYLGTLNQQLTVLQNSVSGINENTSTQELISLSSLSWQPITQLGSYIQAMAIAESENTLLIMPSLSYYKYTEDVELPVMNYNPTYVETPIYIDNVTLEQPIVEEVEEDMDNTDYTPPSDGASGLNGIGDSGEEEDVEESEEGTDSTDNIPPSDEASELNGTGESGEELIDSTNEEIIVEEQQNKGMVEELEEIIN